MKEHLESDIPFIGPVSLTGFADVIANKIIKLSGVDLFKNSRKREYVEYRGLLCYILRDKMQMNLQSITDFFKSKEKICITLLYCTYLRCTQYIKSIINYFVI